MMIRERPGKGRTTVQLIRVSWDKDRQRSVQRVLGVMPSYADRLPDDLAGPDSPLTPEERAQALAWVEEHRAAGDRILLPGLSGRTIEALDKLSAALANPGSAPAVLDRLDPAALFGAVGRLEEALRQHGMRRARTRKAAQDASQEVSEAEMTTGSHPTAETPQKPSQELPEGNPVPDAGKRRRRNGKPARDPELPEW